MNDDLKKRLLYVLADAERNITHMRARIDVLQAQVDVVMVFRAALAGNSNMQGMAMSASSDMLWEISRIREALMQPEPAAEACAKFEAGVDETQRSGVDYFAQDSNERSADTKTAVE